MHRWPRTFTRLGRDGVLVKERRSQRDPDQITGYAVALATGREPVWFGGGKLAPDLSLLRLQDRWASSSPRLNPRPAHSDGERTSPLGAADRARLLEQARLSAQHAAEHIHTHGGDTAAVADATWASADLFAAAARVCDYRHRTGKVTQAADLYEQAARPAHRRTPQATAAGQHLRSAAGALLAVRRTLPSETRQALALLTQLQSLAATVTALDELASAGVLAKRRLDRRTGGYLAMDVFALITTAERQLASTCWDTGTTKPARPTPYRADGVGPAPGDGSTDMRG